MVRDFPCERFDLGPRFIVVGFGQVLRELMKVTLEWEEIDGGRGSHGAERKLKERDGTVRAWFEQCVSEYPR